MIPFPDRAEAGKILAASLEQYKNQTDAIVLGLPRGGVVVAFEVAKALALPMDLIVTKKVGAPGNPELALGAVDDMGNGHWNHDLIDRLNLTIDELEQFVVREKQEIRSRLDLYRHGHPPLDLKKKCAILVDDGLATGLSMLAAVHSARGKRADSIVVAVPVGSIDSAETVRREVDELICLKTPADFQAVGQYYLDFPQITHEEVVALMEKAKHRRF